MILFKISAIKGIIQDLQKFIDSDQVPADKKDAIIIQALGQINGISSLETINRIVKKKKVVK